ncbi:MAG: BolA/IbaG family iron-sulfur metabolism protein [Proteobacteria bacterium]|nr:BolA/IbaG family iron-sulfur metabolism protein [Pseudomonadota bacterium]
MNPQSIADLIRAALPDSRVQVRSDDHVHYEAVVITPAFAGKRLVARHQMVYAALGPRMGNEIHAMALQVLTPEEAARSGMG